MATTHEKPEEPERGEQNHGDGDNNRRYQSAHVRTGRWFLSGIGRGMSRCDISGGRGWGREDRCRREGLSSGEGGIGGRIRDNDGRG